MSATPTPGPATTATRAHGSVRSRTRLTSRPAPPSASAALPAVEEDVDRAVAAVLVDRDLAAVSPVSPMGSATEDVATGDPAAGPPRVGQPQASGPSAASRRAAGWNPGEGAWVPLRQAIERHVIYPTIARRMGWTGKVILTFVLAGDGNVEDVRIRESSGHAVLDQSAVQAVYRAVPLPHANEAIRIVMPVEFSLL
jgi:periplasmic protein TonB